MVVGERFGFYGINLSKNDKIKTYTSSNPKVATVSEKGVIDAISPGVVTITAVTENNKKLHVELEFVMIYLRVKFLI